MEKLSYSSCSYFAKKSATSSSDDGQFSLGLSEHPQQFILLLLEQAEAHSALISATTARHVISPSQTGAVLEKWQEWKQKRRNILEIGNKFHTILAYTQQHHRHRSIAFLPLLLQIHILHGVHGRRHCWCRSPQPRPKQSISLLNSWLYFLWEVCRATTKVWSAGWHSLLFLLYVSQATTSHTTTSTLGYLLKKLVNLSVAKISK